MNRPCEAGLTSGRFFIAFYVFLWHSFINFSAEKCITNVRRYLYFLSYGQE